MPTKQNGVNIYASMQQYLNLSDCFCCSDLFDALFDASSRPVFHFGTRIIARPHNVQFFKVHVVRARHYIAWREHNEGLTTTKKI